MGIYGESRPPESMAVGIQDANASMIVIRRFRWQALAAPIVRPGSAGGRLRAVESMLPGAVELSGGSKWVSAQPTGGSEWVSAQPTGGSKCVSAQPTYFLSFSA